MKKLSKQQIEEAIETWKGNWLKWDSFAWFHQPDDSENWCIIETHHRDSPIKDVSNGRYFHQHLNPLVDDTEDVIEWGANHWAVGYTDGWAVRVVDKDGDPTPAFLVLAGLLAEREEKDVLDQDDYDRRIEEEKRKNIERCCQWDLPKDCSLKDGRPDDWVDRVLDQLAEIDEDWEDDLDSDGAPTPRIGDLVKALDQLGWLGREAA
jgi:hypothetical protein